MISARWTWNNLLNMTKSRQASRKTGRQPQPRREQELARLAKAFFAQPDTVEETKERQDWLKLTAETQRRDR